jgi:peptidoglycan/LPS O-acetylase OafA/YrhL
MAKVYFPGLNGLRFIGAFAVIICHIEFLKSLHGLPNIMNYPFYKNTSGHQGVILFFVLSGFLITYLLLNEFSEKSTIEIGKFYMRRVLRIWPLYYLMILISVFIVPIVFSFFEFSIKNGYTWNEMKFYLLFLPNLSKSMGHHINGAVHLWSVGVEEQFYFIWPFIILWFRKWIFALLLLIFFSISLLPLFLDYVHVRTEMFSGSEILYKQLAVFIPHFKINSMAVGGLIAYVVYERKNWLVFFMNDVVEVLVFFGTIILWSTGTIIPQFTDEIYSILFGIIILNIATKKNPLIKLENRFFTFLGQISYGLYVYHWIIILAIIEILKQNLPNYNENILVVNLILYTGSISLTVFISYLSYEYFEKPFLKIKRKFE